MSALPVLRERADELRLFDPDTGEELVPAEATTDRLAATRAYIVELERGDLAEAKRLIDRELLVRMDRDARWSVTANGWKVSARSPAPEVEYDAEELRMELLRLVDDGILTIDAADAAVAVECTYKARKVGINALLKLGGEVADVVRSCAQEVDRSDQRKVRVERS